MLDRRLAGRDAEATGFFFFLVRDLSAIASTAKGLPLPLILILLAFE
jgi:hypothetical protein